MSLTERRRLQQLVPELPDGSGISRSRSFAGFLNRSLSRKESMNPSSHGQDYRMLIQRSSDQRLRSVKVPKTPRPLRALTIIDALRNGLQECIQLTNDDMKGLLNGNERLPTQNTQQLKAADRYLKRLELQLSKLEELGENYNVQHRLREGVRNMAQAYMSSSGKEKNHALGNVKAGYKECTQAMCTLEAQLEQMMGSLEMRMKGVAGFARLCPGDTFEIIIRHGEQKWKSRGHVNKDASQSWDQEAAIFKSLLGDIMHIKASEVRTLGNRIIVGNKHCETKDLFSAHPQVMTISLNSNGSLKLSLIISWNPLDGIADQNVWSPWMLKANDSTLPKPNRDPVAVVTSPAKAAEELLPHRSVYSSTISVASDRHSSVSPKTEASNAGSMSPSNMSVTPSQESLENAIRAVVSSVRDIRGRYSQLFNLETQIFRLGKILLVSI
ncbi:hypothetical protein RvY_09407-2 [Ramazzottius varieornatus]|uniref:FAM65 N-terminal domain-containing protein n=1 Tax=Ramazzottius varieornatus TaxID=947166 RepID=A0A1D1VDU0_RAMVA|nr:hypothetical protein RvY_09407-2 [Ramazzottius varieornatus]